MKDQRVTNMLLIALILLAVAILFQPGFDGAATAQAQRAVNEGQSTNMISPSELAIANAGQSVAKSNQDVANAIREVAASNREIASAIKDLGASLQSAAATIAAGGSSQ